MKIFNFVLFHLLLLIFRIFPYKMIHNTVTGIFITVLKTMLIVGDLACGASCAGGI